MQQADASTEALDAAMQSNARDLSASHEPSRGAGRDLVGGDGSGGDGVASDTAEREAGFTLLEILVVIVILGLLIGLVAPAALRQLGGARVSVARQSIERLGAVLDLYKLDIGSYPSTDQGLQALATRPLDLPGWNGPYVKADQGLQDAWNHPYVYRNPSTRSGHDYDLCSRGPNAQGQGDAQGGEAGLICNP